MTADVDFLVFWASFRSCVCFLDHPVFLHLLLLGPIGPLSKKHTDDLADSDRTDDQGIFSPPLPLPFNSPLPILHFILLTLLPIPPFFPPTNPTLLLRCQSDLHDVEKKKILKKKKEKNVRFFSSFLAFLVLFTRPMDLLFFLFFFCSLLFFGLGVFRPPQLWCLNSSCPPPSRGSFSAFVTTDLFLPPSLFLIFFLSSLLSVFLSIFVFSLASHLADPLTNYPLRVLTYRCMLWFYYIIFSIFSLNVPSMRIVLLFFFVVNFVLFLDVEQTSLHFY